MFRSSDFMNRKLIFLDIDGTLVAPLSPPSPEVRGAIRAAQSNGHKVFLSTGRNLAIIGPEIMEVGFDGVVASAGAYVSVGSTVLLDQLLTEETVQECLNVFHGLGMFCRIESPEGIYTDPQMEELLRSATPDPQNSELIRMQKEIETGIVIQKYENYPKQGAYKLCFTSRSLDPVWEAKKLLGDRFEFVVHPYANCTACFNGEIIPHGVDKGRGIELVCQHLGASIEDTIAFGDSMNDAPMLERAEVAVAMGNSSDEVKALADIVCEDVDHDGVALELRRMGLC